VSWPATTVAWLRANGATMWREPRRYLVLTPVLDGADGISELSRQVVRTLVAEVGADRVEVWALDGGVRALRPGEPAPAFRSARGSRWRLVRWTLARAAGRLDELTIVVMHAHLAPIGGLLACRGARTAVFLIGVEVWRRLRARERGALGRADLLIAISRFTADRFRQANPDVRVRSLRVCPLGIGPAPCPEAPSADREFALIVGRLWAQEQYKGHDRLIDIWPAVRGRAGGARLLVVGDGDDRARLEARVEAEGLGDAIRFAGRLTDAELAGVYRAAAFFVMPSTGEGFGLAYLEAMRAGKPCIALHGSADEIIDDGVDGVLVDAASSDELTEAIVRLFTDRGLRARMGASASARVARDFTGECFAARFRAALGLAATPVAEAESQRCSSSA
jgi:phosphatidylinositol alpha-1,6-mannosyltransferase